MSCSLVMVAASGSCLHEQPEEEQGVDLTAAAPWRPGRGEGGCRGVGRRRKRRQRKRGRRCAMERRRRTWRITHPPIDCTHFLNEFLVHIRGRSRAKQHGYRNRTPAHTRRIKLCNGRQALCCRSHGHGTTAISGGLKHRFLSPAL